MKYMHWWLSGQKRESAKLDYRRFESGPVLHAGKRLKA